MQNLKVSQVYGAKCYIINKDIYISTRASSQLDSNVVLSITKPIENLTFSIDEMSSSYPKIELSIITENNEIIPIGTLIDKNSIIDVSLKNRNFSIKEIKFVIKSTTKEQKNIVLKSIAA